ncbi:disulfide bond formation protein B [Tropicimonas isoalkanivorans]|uniref:Disulfide bond formation protein DsbB n=1 Tax=Tropicimonas isoalkanivorans TaxID=441112 RepID=A0A1I1K1L9_9RHOB|nr:disulfide bond formation protein B [Tropicimonas isoalkanivorans]SFC54857.1 Disulfide bond formation protein DsbB [Tropicimonas isoalkanivorans]
MSPRLPLALALAGSVASLAGAFFFQYVMAILPCHLCILQRWPHAILVVLAALALIWPKRLVIAAGALVATVSIGLAIYHSGVERKLWAGPTDCTGGQDLSGLSGQDLLSTDFTVGVVQCDEISYSILGLSFANYNVLLSLGLIVLWLLAWRRA